MTLESLDIKQQKLRQLQQILPEIFEDGEIIPEKLKDVFADEVNESREHYSFTWAGKRDCYKTIREKTNATLKVDEDKEIPDGDNVFIEGDNLEVLKLLQLSYHKKVKMIYIDPPYNKDKDFVYSDTWGDSIQNYLIQTDQLRNKGYTTTKTNSTGRRHTNWLNMIYPRLWLSRNLLKDDGVIFVSIDDDEVHNLRKVMDEIYGEENFVGQLILKTATDNNKTQINVEHEYMIVYAKNIELQDNWERKSENALKIQKKYLELKEKFDDDTEVIQFELRKWIKSNKNELDKVTHYDNVDDKGVFHDGDIANTKFGGYKYEVLHEVTRKPCKIPAKGFRFPENTMRNMINNNDILFGKDETVLIKPKKRLLNAKDVLRSMIYEDGRTSTKVFESMMGRSVFDNPKSHFILSRLIGFVTKNDDIILDFFAGSGTTAHAVMDLNKEDGGNRKYILVQLPEATDEKSEAYKAGYTKISDITKERIKRAMKKLDYQEGFKSFRLDNSNFQIFKEVKKRPDMSYEEIEKMLKMSMFHENILTQGAKALDIVYEVGLKNGFTLSAEIGEVKTDNYSFITLSEDEKIFYFSFDKEITGDIVHDVPKDAKLICYEKALTTNVKLNLRENLDLEVL
ncbi:site-specific DNA-methyltransferase [Sulfurovum lithotrophicum]|uniref:site-specific DNA-methyltransferase n=1 Tax=Sulfurovum lithotrophicum TaxID=206403 RepID=UPI0006974718|nr:site-specific DNA-methyltransferase [Sulfurovum lithotrophicum]